MSSENNVLSQITCPNTAEEFLRIILVTMQTLSKRVENMEIKLDRFLSNKGPASLTCEAATISNDISRLADDCHNLGVNPAGALDKPNVIQNKVNSG